MYKGQSSENRTPATKWQWNLFHSKIIARSVNTFIPLRGETINFSLVERHKSLMDPQPHPLLHFLLRMKPTSRNVFLQVAKKYGSHKEKDLGCKEDVEVFPSQISEAYPTTDWQYWDWCYHAKGWFRPTAFHGVLTLWRAAALCHQEMIHTSLLFFACLHFQCWTKTLYTKITSRPIKKQLCGPVCFHYACLLSYRWRQCCQLLGGMCFMAGVRF